jgi:hypothetical protein
MCVRRPVRFHIPVTDINNMTYQPTATQRLGKNIPEVTLSTIELHPLLGNEPINTRL